MYLNDPSGRLNCEHEIGQNMIKFLRSAAFLLCTAVGTPTMAQNFDKGIFNYSVGDYTTALQELRPLAEQGHALAQSNLGLMYANGDGVIQDYAKAVSWYRLSAEQGHVLAQSALAYMYVAGNGVLQDDAEAMNWYRKAAEQGDSFSQYKLGLMYANGISVIEDDVIAHMWYNISGANGEALASELLDKIKQSMTREEIAEAQSLARRCMSSDYQDCGLTRGQLVTATLKRWLGAFRPSFRYLQ
jgi:TPR repeat protein